MKNQAALVTGGAKRIGKAISIFLAKSGYDIALHYNTSDKEVKEVKKEIEKIGQKCLLVKCNFNNLTKVKGLIKKIKKELPRLSVLINNASIFEEGLFLNTKLSDLEKHFSVNLKAPFILSQEFAVVCKKGNIINILDTNITRKHSKYFAYTLSKKTLLEFTKMAAYDLAPNIRVNAIAPGPILPPFGKDDRSLTLETLKIPLKHKGNLEDINLAIKYLIENNFVTGECLFVDGGKHLCHKLQT